ncbi:hypothetical protein FRC14_001077 [Serendipita sp. 396]|nr:hypothetical protein FRC14_001077 [Serendipita sp. 396]
MNRVNDASSSSAQGQTNIPYKQIRAHCPTPDTIVIYQAYPETIADAAVATGRLNASSEFNMDRMIWIKPSFYLCMYRYAWSYKGAREARILAITMTMAGFLTWLRNAVPSTGSDASTPGTDEAIRAQWDPERNIKLEKLSYRSLLLGVSGDWVETWINEWIVGIEDITEDVRRWKSYIDEDGKKGRRKVQREVTRKWPEEVVAVDEEIEERLEMRNATG